MFDAGERERLWKKSVHAEKFRAFFFILFFFFSTYFSGVARSDLAAGARFKSALTIRAEG